MSDMSDIEVELLNATKFRGDKYPDRQDYLAALLVAIDKKLTNDDYELLSDEAVEWHNAAVAAHEAKEEIPDFDGSVQHELPLTDPEHPLHRGPDADDSEDEDAKPSVELYPDSEAASGEEEPPPPVKKPTKKGAAKGKARAERKPVSYKNPQPNYTALTGERDKFGITIGTKTHKAVQMYEKGSTASQVEEALEGRYRNILTKLRDDGHKVEKLAGGVFKLTHRDEV